tara:strand:+ start:421 stop:597 length:177 start_codon:yes stop_codon:yes gene_type:complete
MTRRKATNETITRLFTVYRKRGFHKHKAIMLIAASLGYHQVYVLDVLEQQGVYESNIV